MFNIGFLELIVVLLVAFLIVGQIKWLKRIIREVKAETGWDEFAKELESAGSKAALLKHLLALRKVLVVSAGATAEAVTVVF